MTDHIVEATKKVIDLDALEKLADRCMKAKGYTARWEALDAFEAAANPAAIKALISELREARSENDRLKTAASLAEDDKLVMAHELREARGLLKAANHSQALIIAAAGGQVEITRDLMREHPNDWMLEQWDDPATGRLVCRAFLSKAQGGE